MSAATPESLYLKSSFYEQLIDTYRARGLEPYVDELDDVVRSLEDAG